MFLSSTSASRLSSVLLSSSDSNQSSVQFRLPPWPLLAFSFAFPSAASAVIRAPFPSEETELRTAQFASFACRLRANKDALADNESMTKLRTEILILPFSSDAELMCLSS